MRVSVVAAGAVSRVRKRERRRGWGRGGRGQGVGLRVAVVEREVREMVSRLRGGVGGGIVVVGWWLWLGVVVRE